MANFGATKAQRPRHTYLGHRVLGDATRLRKKVSQASSNPPKYASMSKLELIKAGGNSGLRLKGLKSRRERASFNLDDDDSDDEILLRDGAVPVTQATRQHILSAMQHDDFDGSGLIASDDEEDEKQLDATMTNTLQFGEGGAAENSTGGEKSRGLSRKERMAQIIEATRLKRACAGRIAMEQTTLLDEADQQILEVVKELDILPPRNAVAFSAVQKEVEERNALIDFRTKRERSRDDDFDRLMKQLAKQPRGRAAERILTPAEQKLAAEKKAEVARQKQAEDIARGREAAPGESEGETDYSDSGSGDSDDESSSAE